MADPFTEANQAIWSALLASDEFVGLVRAGNRVATVDVDATLKGKVVNRAPADCPEVLVTERGLAPVPSGRNSKTFDASQTYTIQIVDNRYTATRLNEVKWAALKAFAVASRDNPPFGLTFLRGWEWLPGTEGRSADDGNQPRGDWVSVFDVRMDFAWPLSDII